VVLALPLQDVSHLVGLPQDVVFQGPDEQDHVGRGARFLLRTMISHTIHEITMRTG
jgi:hypothetical protein